MERVSWIDCHEFIKKLNDRAKDPRRKFRLPTEAQWEYACRAGTTRNYSFGDGASELGQYAWYAGNARRKSQRVGQKQPNAWGLYDMHGNVWEWCADWYDPGYYANSPLDDPSGPTTGTDRVTRGGGWYSDARRCRSAFRDGYAPGVRNSYLGFRIVLVPTE